jgi:hypothetical protein
MAEPTQAELMSLLTGAIARSHLHDPVRIDGTTWDNMNVSNEEASHYAKAVLTVLSNNRLKIVEAESTPASKAIASTMSRA